MSNFGRAFGALLIAGGLGAAAVLVAPYFESSYAGQNGPQIAESTQQPAPSRIPTPLSAFFSNGSAQENDAEHINAICGLSDIWSGGNQHFELAGDAPGQFSVLKTRDGSTNLFERFSAPADQLHAFRSYNEVYVQIAEGRFDARNYLLSDTGEVEFSGPLFNGARQTVACFDEATAAETVLALNALFESRGAQIDKVRAGVRAFAVGHATDEREAVDSLLTACTLPDDLAELPAGQRILIGARLDLNGQYGEDVVIDMSGEALGGRPAPILDLQIAQIDESGEFAVIESHGLPVTDWTDLTSSESGFSPYYRFDAVEIYGFTISIDGATSHSVYQGLANGVDVPCHDIEAGQAVFAQLRNSALR